MLGGSDHGQHAHVLGVGDLVLDADDALLEADVGAEGAARSVLGLREDVFIGRQGQTDALAPLLLGLGLHII